MRPKFLKSRRDRHKGEEIDVTTNLASEKAKNRKPVSGAFGHSNFGRNISPDAGKTGAKLSGGKAVNPAGGVGKGFGMNSPTMSGSKSSEPGMGTKDRGLKKRRNAPKYLRMRG